MAVLSAFLMAVSMVDEKDHSTAVPTVQQRAVQMVPEMAAKMALTMDTKKAAYSVPA